MTQLRNRGELISVKKGEYPWREVEPRILERLEAVDVLREHAPFIGAYDADFAESCVPACYDGRKTTGR
jgi:hypothetical protein